MDPRSPVLVGVAQHSVRDSTTPVSPLGLLCEVSRGAAADTAATPDAVLRRLDSVTVINCLTWQVPDPAATLAAELGLGAVDTTYTQISGTSPAEALADAATRIRDGEANAVLIAGAETVKALRDGRYTGGPDHDTGAPDRTLGTDAAASHPAELAAGLDRPIHYYPLFENAIRAASGADPGTHTERVAALWSRFAAVAADNPHAWVREAPGAETIVEVTESNRMIAAPYRKLMTANAVVDQAAALLLTSAQAATELGVPRERWVFPHAFAAGHDHWLVGNRAELHRSPALHRIGDALADLTGRPLSRIEHVDLYSCFPAAVQVAAAEFGLDTDDPARELTVTGGLTFAGGPVSNYVTHALATLVDRLRADPAAMGLSTAVGWYLTKHAGVLLSASEPARPFEPVSVQRQVDATPSVRIAQNPTGQAAIETYTVSYDAGVPQTGHVAARLPDGSRAFARTGDDPDGAQTLDALLARDPAGAGVQLARDGTFTLPSAV
jgi:acetyl-CoA C-acetyltransferase